MLITAKQQRKESIGSYNHMISTPVLDALVDDGTVFDRSYMVENNFTADAA
jgi:hypothetical protein